VSLPLAFALACVAGHPAEASSQTPAPVPDRLVTTSSTASSVARDGEYVAVLERRGTATMRIRVFDGTRLVRTVDRQGAARGEAGEVDIARDAQGRKLLAFTDCPKEDRCTVRVGPLLAGPFRAALTGADSSFSVSGGRAYTLRKGRVVSRALTGGRVRREPAPAGEGDALSVDAARGIVAVVYDGGEDPDDDTASISTTVHRAGSRKVVYVGGESFSQSPRTAFDARILAGGVSALYSVFRLAPEDPISEGYETPYRFRHYRDPYVRRGAVPVRETRIGYPVDEWAGSATSNTSVLLNGPRIIATGPLDRPRLLLPTWARINRRTATLMRRPIAGTAGRRPVVGVPYEVRELPDELDDDKYTVIARGTTDAAGRAALPEPPTLDDADEGPRHLVVADPVASDGAQPLEIRPE